MKFTLLYRSICITVLVLILIGFCPAYAQDAEKYAGKMVYVSVDQASYSIDSITVYYSPEKILMMSIPSEDSKSIAYRRVADLRTRKQYWIIDSKKLVLEEDLKDEYAKRKFEELPGTTFVQNLPARSFISELKFPVVSGSGLEEYIMKISVAGMAEASILPENLYLLDYGFYRGRMIVKRDSDAYFAENKDRSRKSSLTLMDKFGSSNGPPSTIPAGYTRKPFSLHEFLTAFERPWVDDLIRFYLDGSLKN